MISPPPSFLRSISHAIGSTSGGQPSTGGGSTGPPSTGQSIVRGTTEAPEVIATTCSAVSATPCQIATSSMRPCWNGPESSLESVLPKNRFPNDSIEPPGMNVEAGRERKKFLLEPLT